MENTVDNWLELRVGDANDKAKDYFTQGDIKFIKDLLSRQKQELKEKIEGMRITPPTDNYVDGANNML